MTPTSDTGHNGGGYTVPAAVDILRAGHMTGHLFLFHSTRCQTGTPSAELKAEHEALHREGYGKPHMHSPPEPAALFTWE